MYKNLRSREISLDIEKKRPELSRELSVRKLSESFEIKAFHETAQTSFISKERIVNEFKWIFYILQFVGIKRNCSRTSTTNALLAKTENGFRCMTYRISTAHQEIRRRLKEYLTRETRLTLWNIYLMDFPLVITSFGALFTYGMLLATLGKTS
ncbi:hypothetical protein TNCT_67981 [Trichonephila clavata]|uniref:Uncharacterized protein n=1 Tax=Trichonephila clavata TaxID=2740835 RepID=A0A8X6LYE2_TRICU|nr:hypothetical protein TNCT_67981 [Trichonephila clavata]